MSEQYYLKKDKMKKIALILNFSLVSLLSYSQWTYKTVNNGFDDPYPIAYTTENNSSILKLENVDNYIYFYLQGGYFCDDYPDVDLVFVVNGVNKKHTLQGKKNPQSDAVFFATDLMNDEMLIDFKQCSILKVRITESYCDNNTYTFIMDKSTSALNFMQIIK